MKSKGVVYLLHIFLGFLGAGRFYVGDIGMGILNLLTLGGFGFLWVIDLFLLSGRVDYKNAMFMARQANAQAQANSTNVNNNNVNVTIDATALQNLQAAAAANPTVTQPQATPVEQPKEEVNLTKARF